MTVFAGSAITVLVGLAAIISTWTGTYSNYVKPGLRWPLIVSGLVLVGAGIAHSITAVNRRSFAHNHSAQGIGALLVVFVTALALAPPPLGAAAAADRIPNRVSITEAPDPIEQRLREQGPPEQSAPSRPVVVEASPEPRTSTTIIADADRGEIELDVADAPAEPVLDEPAIDEPVLDESTPGTSSESDTVEGLSSEGYAMSLYDLIGYSFFDPDEIIGVPLQLVGFSAPEPDVPGGFRLTRFIMDCCAADAFPLQVTLADPPFVPDDDQWVVVEAVWHGELTDVDEYGDGVPVLEVLSLAPTDPPADPYES